MSDCVFFPSVCIFYIFSMKYVRNLALWNEPWNNAICMKYIEIHIQTAWNSHQHQSPKTQSIEQQSYALYYFTDSIKYSQLKWYEIIHLLLLMFNVIFHVHHFDKIQYNKCACQERPKFLINNIDIVSHHAAFFLVELIWWNKIQRR